MKRKVISIFMLFYFCFPSVSILQENRLIKDQYQIGPDERLLITVHIFGEVKRPGELLVPDDTDILELISKAGGPTEYSNLSNVKITRGLTGFTDRENFSSERTHTTNKPGKQVIKIDLKKILNNADHDNRLPVLQPGDVVRVGRNAWFAWQSIIRVASQLAIIAQVWYWYSQMGE